MVVVIMVVVMAMIVIIVCSDASDYSGRGDDGICTSRHQARNLLTGLCSRGPGRVKWRTSASPMAKV